MKISDQIRAEAVRRRAPSCVLKEYFAKLAAPDQKDLRDVFFDADVSAAAIHAVIAKRGFRYGQSAVKEHRQRRCQTCAADPKGLYGKS